VPAPVARKLTDEQFYSKKDPTKPDLDVLRTHFFNEGRLEARHASFLLKKATDIFKKEGTVLDLDAPLTGICVTFTFSLW
jgi:serine/threonine-protein phosphatase 2B catalytic subunit